MIAIINYGMGNLGSIANMLRRLGVEATVTSDAEMIARSDKLILPGVGSFDVAMANLERTGLTGVLAEQVLHRRKPILGICLGMQLFAKASEEGGVSGLGWIDAEVLRFRPENTGTRLRVPHMGWNSVEVRRPTPLLGARDDQSRFYFVHSYHMVCARQEDVLGTTHYGYHFASCVCSRNILGAQFHPEKSHRYGMQFLKAFVELEHAA